MNNDLIPLSVAVAPTIKVVDKYTGEYIMIDINSFQIYSLSNGIHVELDCDAMEEVVRKLKGYYLGGL